MSDVKPSNEIFDMTNDDFFLRDTHVARVNANGKTDNPPVHPDDDYFRRDGQVARVSQDGNSDSNTSHDDYFRRDNQVARVNDDAGSADNSADKTLRDAIRENAAGPKRVQGDSGSVEQHSLQDQIAADKYLASKEAVRRGIGIKNVKISPGGTT